MEIEWQFGLRLNNLTSVEHALNPNFFQSEYLDYVLEMMADTGRLHIFKEDLLNRFEGKTLEEIYQIQPFLIQPGDLKPNPHQEGRLCPVYYNVHLSMAITRQHLFYDYFVATLLRQVDLMDIDSLLEYAMIHDDHFCQFARFLHLTMRKYHWVIQEQIAATIREWIEAKEKQFRKEDEFWDLKFKLKRLRTGTETILTQHQTVLLICYMQKAKIIMDEKNALSATYAAKCFEVLTAYSSNTLRQDMSKYLNLVDRENLAQVREALLCMIEFMNNDLKAKTRLLT